MLESRDMAKKTKENNIFSNMEASELNSNELPGYTDEFGSFPERLREIIGGQSVRSFAAECHLSDGVVRQYLAGKSEPGLESLLAIAATANVSVDWLATGFGNKDDGRFGDKIALARKKRGANHLFRKAEEEAIKAVSEGEMELGTTTDESISNAKSVVADPGGSFAQDAESEELCRLLKRYGNRALVEDVKARLLKIKQVVEG